MQKTNVFKYIDMKGGDSSVCWPWTGALGKKNERPYVRVGKRVRLAYQVVWELVNGEDVGVRLIRHTCDNPICCNPKHLKIGTQRENMKDMKERDRHGISRIVKNAWLNLAAKGVKPQVIADRYGVTASAVRQFLRQAEKTVKEDDDGSSSGEEGRKESEAESEDRSSETPSSSQDETQDSSE
jgi:hypothetical protein